MRGDEVQPWVRWVMGVASPSGPKSLHLQVHVKPLKYEKCREKEKKIPSPHETPKNKTKQKPLGQHNNKLHSIYQVRKVQSRLYLLTFFFPTMSVRKREQIQKTRVQVSMP